MEEKLTVKDREELNDYIKSISCFPKLTYNELNYLLKDISNNKEKFFYGYLCRVVPYAKYFYCSLKDYFVFPYGIVDFIQDGNEVLFKLINNIENDGNISLFNLKFYTMFRRKLIQNNAHISTHSANRYIDFIDSYNDYIKMYQYEPSFDCICKQKEYGQRRSKFLKNCYLFNQETIEFIDDVISDDIDIEDAMDVIDIHDMLLEIFDEASLTEKEKDIIIKYFGFNYGTYQGENLISTFIELGKDYGISRQRVEQIYKKALNKIKYNSEILEKVKRYK